MLLFLTLLTTSLIVWAKLPSNVQKCVYESENISDCIVGSVTTLLSMLDHPLPEFGLANLEPLDIKSFSIGSGSGLVDVQEHFQNAKMYGLRQMKILEAILSLEQENMVLNFTTLFPSLKIFAEYALNGKVMVMPIQGNGSATLVLTNLTGLINLPLEKVYKNKMVHLHVTKSAYIRLPHLGLLEMNFENLYNGNEVLGEVINKVLNENWDPLFDDVRSGWERLFTRIVVNIANRFFAKVPLVELLDNLDPKILA